MAKLKNYNGSVSLMAGITQKGGGDFAMVEANAVQTREDGTRLDAELEALQNNIGTKADSDHNHDDVYYTEAEVDEKIDTLNAKFASLVFIGTYAEYQTAYANGQIPINTFVILTDDGSSGGGSGSGDSDGDATTAKLGYAVLGKMVLG